ncbi:MAG: hypothetical protein ACK2T7_11590 [Anaerolineales bacterium]
MGSGGPGWAIFRTEPGSKSGVGSRRFWAAVIFTLGVLVGMVMMGASIYADFEATLFDVFLNASSSPRLIHCPILLSSKESGLVTTSIRNRSDEPVVRLVRTHISRGHLTLMREFEERLEIDPGEVIDLEWAVTEKDAAYGHLIFAKVIFLESAIKPITRGSCGILVLPLPWGLHGWTVVVIMYLISFTFIISSLVLWWRYGRSYSGIRLEATRAMMVLGVDVLIGLVFALIGIWEVAALTFYISILAIGVIVPHFLINFILTKGEIFIE